MDRGVGSVTRPTDCRPARARARARRRQTAVLLVALLDAVVLAAGVSAGAGAGGAPRLERAPVFALAARPEPAEPIPAVATGARAPEPATARVVPAPAPPLAPPAAPQSRPIPATPVARGAAALELIRYPWQQLGVAIVFLPGRAGILGKTFPERSRIEMYVRPAENTIQLAYMTAHEIGHMVDWRYGNGPRRSAWKQLRGIPASVPWFGPALGGGDDLATPAGDFAETFAYWQIGPVDYASRMGPPPDAAQLERMPPLFNR